MNESFAHPSVCGQRDGKPVIMLNHTEDGSGNSFLPRVKTLGKADLLDAEWREVPEEGDDG